MKTVLSSIGGQSVSKAYDEADNSDATAPLQSGAVGTSGTIVTVDLKAGTRGKNYPEASNTRLLSPQVLRPHNSCVRLRPSWPCNVRKIIGLRPGWPGMPLAFPA
jgi:hypothetical protein